MRCASHRAFGIVIEQTTCRSRRRVSRAESVRWRQRTALVRHQNAQKHAAATQPILRTAVWVGEPVAGRTDVPKERLFAVASEMASRLSRFPWMETPLGAMDSWSQPFVAFVRYMLLARDPVWITWGGAHTMLYNDACAERLLATRHPQALGQPAAEVWGDLWPLIQANASRQDWWRWQEAVAVAQSSASAFACQFFNFARTPIGDGGDGNSASGALWLATDCAVAMRTLRRHGAEDSREIGRDVGYPSSVVHDLRAPLNTILAWSQVLAGGVDSVDLSRGLDAIARSARLQAGLLSELGAPRGDPQRTDGPLASAEAPDATARPQLDANLSGLNVLMVDDDDDARAAMTRVLSDAGAEVAQAASAAAGLACLRRGRVDVMVSDITMPRTNGYDFMATVRGDGAARVRATPALALTALSSSLARQRAYRAGFQLCLEKPVEPAELRLAVASLSAHRDRSSLRRRGAG